MNTGKSRKLFDTAQKLMPGGVSSPVRAFRNVDSTPVFIKKGSGAYIWDEDGNKYVDLINAWGPMILGHANPDVLEGVSRAMKNSFTFGASTKKEIDLAKLIREAFPSMEKIRFVNSGTEAAMTAVRLARGYAVRNKIIKFDGCYHGHADALLVQAGSGPLTHGTPSSKGVPPSTVADTISLPYNNMNGVREAFANHRGHIAAVIVEPVAGNMGCVPPDKTFLENLRRLCTEENILLIFDEVITGFRLAPGGAQEYFGISADLTILGKVIGGGMPIGAIGGKEDIMNTLSPEGPVYQAGTFSGNPVAMTAGYETLKILLGAKKNYKLMEEKTNDIIEGYRLNLARLGLNYTMNQSGTMFTLFFTPRTVTDLLSAMTSSTRAYSEYFRRTLHKGVYLPPSQFECCFVSHAVERKEIKQIISANYEALKKKK